MDDKKSKSNPETDITGKKEQHDCNLCGKSFPSETALIIHKNNFHTGNFSCHLCKYAFKNLVLLEAHIGKIHKT